MVSHFSSFGCFRLGGQERFIDVTVLLLMKKSYSCARGNIGSMHMKSPFFANTPLFEGVDRSLNWWKVTDISMPALKGLSQLLVLLFSVPFDLLQLFLCKINFQNKFYLVGFIFVSVTNHCQCGQMKREKSKWQFFFVSKQKILFCGVECCLSCWSN